MDANEYAAAIAAIRTAIAGPPGLGNRVLPAANANPVYINVQVTVEPGLVFNLIYRRCDVYIMGFITAEGATFLFDDTEGIQGTFTRLGFRSEYDKMGWEKDKSNRKITLEKLSEALMACAYGYAGKEHMVAIAIGMAEALRFANVEEAVTDGTEVTGKQLKWRSNPTKVLDKANWGAND